MNCSVSFHFVSIKLKPLRLWLLLIYLFSWNLFETWLMLIRNGNMFDQLINLQSFSQEPNSKGLQRTVMDAVTIRLWMTNCFHGKLGQILGRVILEFVYCLSAQSARVLRREVFNYSSMRSVYCYVFLCHWSMWQMALFALLLVRK